MSWKLSTRTTSQIHDKVEHKVKEVIKESCVPQNEDDQYLTFEIITNDEVEQGDQEWIIETINEDVWSSPLEDKNDEPSTPSKSEDTFKSMKKETLEVAFLNLNQQKGSWYLFWMQWKSTLQDQVSTWKGGKKDKFFLNSINLNISILFIRVIRKRKEIRTMRYASLAMREDTTVPNVHIWRKWKEKWSMMMQNNGSSNQRGALKVKMRYQFKTQVLICVIMFPCLNLGK